MNSINLKAKRISPQAIFALQEALAVLFWKKDELRNFIRLIVNNSVFVSSIDWSGTKRESVKEVIFRMTSRPDIYSDSLFQLVMAVIDFTEFPHLKFWDTDGSLQRKAAEAVQNLRLQTKGYLQITQEQEIARKRRIEMEKLASQNKTFEQELSVFKDRFMKISLNKNAQQRGYELEKFLNDLFHLYELAPRAAFKNFGEQIDGAFTFDGTDYLLEAKWKQQVDRGDLASFCFKVDSKLKIAMGLLVSIQGVTPEAIAPYFKSIIIMDGADINAILENRVSLPDLLLKKRRRANETGNIYVSYSSLL